MQPLMMANINDVYRKQGVLTASPIELIVMLYDGLKKDLLLTQMAIKNKNMETAHKKLINAQDIVSELINSLDFGFPISNDLFALYDFMLRTLEEINAKKDADLIPDLMEIVDSLKETWREVADIQRSKLALQSDEQFVKGRAR
ncbi:MAG: flagellar export chaperone FliS [Clostridiales bacterium]|jgi:flagellar protein FliS|nr:flagellar export chaperone FliS [Clostridiales bacterium]